MMLAPPPLPVDESERLDALRRLQILDTPPSENLDRIARLAARALRVPIVLVSLVDQDRQWFKASVGLDAAETARDASFCAHASGAVQSNVSITTSRIRTLFVIADLEES